MIFDFRHEHGSSPCHGGLCVAMSAADEACRQDGRAEKIAGQAPGIQSCLQNELPSELPVRPESNSRESREGPAGSNDQLRRGSPHAPACVSCSVDASGREERMWTGPPRDWQPDWCPCRCHSTSPFSGISIAAYKLKGGMFARGV